MRLYIYICNVLQIDWYVLANESWLLPIVMAFFSITSTNLESDLEEIKFLFMQHAPVSISPGFILRIFLFIYLNTAPLSESTSSTSFSFSLREFLEKVLAKIPILHLGFPFLFLYLFIVFIYYFYLFIFIYLFIYFILFIYLFI